MTPETVARWQFGITTVYHFFFVPVTIALSLLVAVMQTMWYRTSEEKFLRLTKFFGKLFLINFAMGVVTGIVQEFQFGMNWSEYSRFVGDIFGAPLAFEALLAFFMESVFLGVWIFGWDKLSKKLHLATIWLAAIGTMLSAIFILAANSFMQNPVGATYNPKTDRAEMTDFLALFTNPAFLVTFPHVLAGAYLTVGGLILAVAGFHLAKLNKANRTEREERDYGAYRWATKFGAWVMIIGGIFTFGTGHAQGQIYMDLQPMKMAAAEAHYETAGGPGKPMANFNIVAIPNADNTGNSFELGVPGVLGLMAYNDPGAKVEGINDLQKAYTSGKVLPGPNTELQKAYAAKLKTVGITDYRPNISVTFWTFRLMIGLGSVAFLLGAYVLFLLRKGGTPKDTALWRSLLWIAPLFPLFANSVGWILTEMGRQPWIVAGVLPTASAVSPGVTMIEVVLTMVLYTVIYGALAVVELYLFNKYARAGLPEVTEPTIKGEDEVLSFAY